MFEDDHCVAGNPAAGLKAHQRARAKAVPVGRIEKDQIKGGADARGLQPKVGRITAMDTG
jgi:hypothetical protein